MNFAPELTGTGKYTGEMVEWLVGAGHEVRVITTPPYYPDWKVAPEYRGWRYTSETWRGARVYRAPLWVPQSPGGAKRLVHLSSFAASSLPPLMVQSIAWRPHVLWCIAPAMACAPGAALFARLSGALSWLHLQDFEVDAAFGLGMLRGKAMRTAAAWAERSVLQSFDRVSSISQRMVEKLGEKGVGGGRAIFLPNWVDTDAIRPMPSGNAYRRALGIPDSAFVALYSGTMGAKQGLEILAETARRVAHRTEIHFLFCGQGAGRASMQEACAGIPRVHWLPLQPAERLSELLSTANVHLLPQQGVVADLVLPSKLTGMLASGRPVLTTAEPETELALWVEGCGRVVAPGDGVALADALLHLAQAPELCRSMGTQARQRALVSLSRNAVLGGVMENLEDAISSRIDPLASFSPRAAARAALARRDAL